MAKSITVRVAIFLAAAGFCFPAPAARKLVTFPPDGPYPVGVTLGHVEFADRTAPVLIWYPASANAGPKYLYAGKLEGTAVLDAEPDRSGAPYPLILFSHGMGGCGCQSVYYTENLASMGYVVAAPDHKDSAMCHIEGPPDVTVGRIALAAIKGGGNLSKTVFTLFEDKFKENEFDFSYRPIEASRTIDQALAWNQDPAHPLRGMMDPERIGATGHSLGGYTTLMVGGVPFHCENVELGPEDCELRQNLTRPLNPCCLKKTQDQDPFQFRDPRIKAILPLGPAVFFPDLPRAASELKVPVMVIAGDNQKMEVPWEPIQTLYDNAPAPKYAIRLKKTDHMTISDMTLAASSLVKPILPGFRSHYDEKAQAAKVYSAAFFDLYLKGDQSQAAVLAAPVNDMVELWAEP